MKMLNNIACNLNFVLTELNSNLIEIGAKGILKCVHDYGVERKN